MGIFCRGDIRGSVSWGFSPKITLFSWPWPLTLVCGTSWVQHCHQIWRRNDRPFAAIAHFVPGCREIWWSDLKPYIFKCCGVYQISSFCIMLKLWPLSLSFTPALECYGARCVACFYQVESSYLAFHSDVVADVLSCSYHIGLIDRVFVTLDLNMRKHSWMFVVRLQNQISVDFILWYLPYFRIVAAIDIQYISMIDI